MGDAAEARLLENLRRYTAGLLGTRAAIERAGLRDNADLVIAMAQNDLKFPKPADMPQRRAHCERARAILQPRLPDGDSIGAE